MSVSQQRTALPDRILAQLNSFQLRQPFSGFVYAVIKKYGDDNGGYQAALLTYYGFLSLFPLLIVATAAAHSLAQHNSALGHKILAGFTTYFPIIGTQIQTNIHSPSQTGLALLVGLIITFYGAKGVADALQYTLNYLWQVPRAKRPQFPLAAGISLLLLAGGGAGIIATSVLSSIATTFGHTPVFTILATLLSGVALFGICSFLMAAGTALHHRFREVWIGALLAAIGLQCMETLGGYLITHELRHLQGAYGQFTLVLAILFWLYLQAQIFVLAVEIHTVYAYRLWPRSLVSSSPTKADEQAKQLAAAREAL